MIKANNGTVEIKGDFITLIADFTTIAKAMYEEAGAKFSDDNMKVLLNDCLQAALEENPEIFGQMIEQALTKAFNKFKAEKEARKEEEQCTK